MVVRAGGSRLSPALEHQIQQNREEAERFRAEFGDPEAALSAIVRRYFDRDGLQAAFDEMLARPGSWLDAPDDTETDGQRR